MCKNANWELAELHRSGAPEGDVKCACCGVPFTNPKLKLKNLRHHLAQPDDRAQLLLQAGNPDDVSKTALKPGNLKLMVPIQERMHCPQCLSMASECPGVSRPYIHATAPITHASKGACAAPAARLFSTFMVQRKHASLLPTTLFLSRATLTTVTRVSGLSVSLLLLVRYWSD